MSILALLAPPVSVASVPEESAVETAPEPTPDVEPDRIEALPFRSVPQPVPPPGARLHLCNAKCQECRPGEKVYMWTWEGGPQWFYPPLHPSPVDGTAF